MKRFISLIIVLIIALAVWAWNGFPRDIVVASTAILAVLGGIGTVLGTTKMMDESFSKKDSVSPLKELFNSSKPLVVQIAHSLPLPMEKTEALKKIRSLANPRKQVEGIFRTILGKKYSQFWQQVDADEILSSLAKDAFWLEGLVLVFEQNKYSFPKNIGRTLAQVMLNQWTDEKLDVKKIIPLESLRVQLGELARWNYPHMRLPGSHEGRGLAFQPYSEYEKLVIDLGELPYPQISLLGKYLWQPLIKLIFKDPQNFYKKLEKLRSPWREIVLLPFYILFDPLNFLKNLILFPFVWVERKLERFANDYEKDTPFRNFLNSFWHNKYIKFKKHAKRFVDRFNINRNRSLRRADLILQCAKKAGILGADGEHIWFTQEYWRDYFTAQTLISDDTLDYFFRKHGFRRQSRLEHGENIAIMTCGLRADPEKTVEKILAYNALVASKCVLVLDDISKDAEEGLRKKILEELVQGIKTVEHDGNSPFCIRSIRAMRSLSDNPYYAHVALEKIPEMYDSDYWADAAKLVASFGRPVFDMLTARIKTANERFIPYILIALGELRDARAIPILRTLLVSAENARVKMMAAVVLATYFKDEAGIPALEKYLRFEFPEKGELSPWIDFDACGEDAIEFGLGVMERAALAPKDYHVADPFGGMIDPMLRKLGDHYKNNSKVETLLLEALSRPQQPRMAHFLIEALGKINSQKAFPALTEFLRHEDDRLRDAAINALKEIDNTMLCSEMIGLLYSANLQLVQSAMWTLGASACLGAIPVLIEKLASDEFEGDPDRGYPIALSAVSALNKISQKFPKNTDAEKGLSAAIDWCYGHLSDKRLVRGHDTVSYKAAFSLNYEINTEKSRQRYFDWITEHPEDRI